MPSTPPPSNSLLNLLNPYASMSRSSHPPPAPDSPSALLLRELSGDAGDEEGDEEEDHDDVNEDEQESRRKRLSPTPKPPTRRPPTHVITDDDGGDDDGEGDGPPASIMYDDALSNHAAAGTSRSVGKTSVGATRRPLDTVNTSGLSGERTPGARSPGPMAGSYFSTRQPVHTIASGGPMAVPTSPGPFKSRGPASSSASEGRHSVSTSPGPSTISVYASGLEGTVLEGTIASSSREPSKSPEKTKVPTFREVPGYKPTPKRTPSHTFDKHKTSNGQAINEQRRGSFDPILLTPYGDPDLSTPPSGAKGKGKAKEKTRSGKRYVALPAAEQEDEAVDGRPEAGKSSKKSRKMGGFPRTRVLPRSGLNEYEKALWKWVNVDDLDGFLQEVYAYYKGKGVYCIALARVLNLLTTFFVIGFSTFLLQCIDYSKLTHISGPTSVGRLDDVLVKQCLTHGSVPHMLFILIVCIFYVFQIFSFILSLPRLFEMYRFYTYLLGIPDADIQTLPWPEIVRLIGEIRKHNPVTSLSNGQAGALADMVGEDIKGEVKTLDAHDVANRILRQENYLIALFNKDLLDLRVRLPVPHNYAHLVPASLLAQPSKLTLPARHADRPSRKYISFGANTLTKALEWNLRFCLLGYLFDRQGQVRKEFVREKRRKDLVEGLKRRFIFMGIFNAIFAPFIIVYLLMYSFFRYFEEYHKNPSSIGGRQYTPYAQWKFREFNELPHLFERRLDRSYPIAKEYIDQFPNERSALVMRFVAFVAGSFAAVLLVASLLDPDLFLHFEVTPHRTVLFYLGLFGSVLAIARGMIPAENLVFDPEVSLREVVRWTHYLPGEWRGKLHSKMVHAEFSNLFALKINVFFTELMSVILTPFILWFSLPPCAGAIIDFFREFTVHVDGVGYVCSFAVFDFRRHGALKVPEPGAPASPNVSLSPQDSTKPGTVPAPSSGQSWPHSGLAYPPINSPHTRAKSRDWRANENKMEKSFLHFKATHPDWQPSDPASSVFLDRLVGMHQASLKADPYNSRQAGSIYSPPGLGRHIGTGMMGSGQPNGARGLGLALGDDARLRERSRSYDRAWAKSSQMLKPRLEAMRENAEMDDEEPVGNSVEVDDWNKRIGDEEIGDDGREDSDEEAFLKDMGMMGLLQQVMRR